MEKITRFCNKNKISKFLSKLSKFEYLYVILIALAILIGPVFSCTLESNDELWNFQNLYKIYNGCGIYTDTNIIITPLFFYIALIFTKLFGANIISFRIYNLVVSVFLYLGIYILTKIFVNRKFNSFVYSTCIMFIIKSIVSGGANYNLLSIVFVLFGLVLFFKIKEKQRTKLDRKNSYKYVLDNVFIGISMFVVFFTKQNIGVYYILSILLCNFVQSIRDKNKKEFIKKSFIQLFSSFILLLAFLIYLYINGELFAFLDNVVFSISEFGTNNFSLNITNIDLRISLYIIIFLSIVTTLFIYYLNKKEEKITKENINKLIDIMLVSIPLLLIPYPIFNIYHVKIAVIVPCIFIAYLIEILVFDNFKEVKYFKIILYISCIILLSILIYNSLKDMTYYLNNKDKYINRIEISNVFDNVIMNEEDIERINKITSYILKRKDEGVKVIVLYQDAALYMVPLKINNNKYDLLFLGNLGKKGQYGVIEELKEMHNEKNTEIFIVSNEEDMFWQESKKVREYITNNMEKINTIDIYDIYI